MNTKFTFKFSSFLFAMGATALLSAQTQVQNTGFEDWRTVTNTNGIFNVPTHWNNINNAAGALALAADGQLTVDQSTETRPGSVGTKSVKITSPFYLISLVNGTLTTGQMQVNSATASDGYVETITGNTDFSQPFTGKPNAIRFWAKYSVTDNTDDARVSAIIHDNFNMTDPDTNPSGSTSPAHIVGTAVQNFQTGGDWKQITVPFTYSGPATDPQYILLTFSSSAIPGKGTTGATLLVDDVEMVYSNTFGFSSVTSTGLQNNYNYNPANNQTVTSATLNMDHIPTTASITLGFNKNATIKAWALLPASIPTLGGTWVQIEPFDLQGLKHSSTHDQPSYTIDLTQLMGLLNDAKAIIPVPSSFQIRVVGSSDTTVQPTVNMVPDGATIDALNFTLNITDDALGTNEIDFKGFQFAPNPVKNQLNLKASSKIQKVEFYNMTGQKVLEAKPENSTAQVGATSLAKGVYLMKVTINGSAKTYKVVKE